MRNDDIRRLLDDEWRLALDDIGEPDADLDRLVNSKVVSIRYALVTQLLGRLADQSRSLTALQIGADDPGAWDARSFSTAVVVPWVSDNQNVLGTSAEPYASKPLRRLRLTKDMPDVRDRGEWNDLVAFFESLADADYDGVLRAFRRVLRSLGRRLAAQSFTYPIPQRISLAQLEGILHEFLAEASGGLRALAVAAALLRVLGEAFSLFSCVRSQGINASDAASGMPGDIICSDGRGPCLVVEVKDMDLTLSHVIASSSKAKRSRDGLSNLLFAAPGIRERDRAGIDSLAAREWASGLNIYTVSIETLCGVAFALLGEQWRVKAIREIGAELDARQNQAARKAWHDILLFELSPKLPQ